MKQTFWKADWYAGLVISPFLLLSGASVFLQRLWRKACDLDLQASSRGAATVFPIIACQAAKSQQIFPATWDRRARL